MFAASYSITIGGLALVATIMPEVNTANNSPAQAATISTKLLGNYQNNGSQDSSNSGTAEAFKYTATVSGTLNQLSVYLDSANTAKVISLGLYSNAGSNPGALLASGTLPSTTAGAWNSVSVPGVAITAGTVYWIAILSPAGSKTPFFDDTNTGISRASISSRQSNLTTFSSTWSSGSSWPNWTMMAYGSAVSGMGVVDAGVPDSGEASILDSGESGVFDSGEASILDSGEASIQEASVLDSGESGVSDSGEAGILDSGSDGGICSQSSTGTGNVIFCEDFNETALDTSQWVAMNREGDPTSGEREYLLPSNVSVSNGLMSISSQPAIPPIRLGADQPPGGFLFSSGMIQWQSFNFTYGTIQYRAKMAGGTATWPAIWLLGANCQQTNIITANNVGTCNWPAPGSDEIDMTEILIQGGPINQEIHVGPGNNVSTENDGCGASAPTGDPESSFHNYEVDWGPGTVVWKVDGKTTCTVAKSYVPSHPMFLIINTALFPSASLSSPWPQYTQVDYVKITQ